MATELALPKRRISVKKMYLKMPRPLINENAPQNVSKRPLNIMFSAFVFKLTSVAPHPNFTNITIGVFRWMDLLHNLSKSLPWYGLSLCFNNVANRFSGSGWRVLIRIAQCQKFIFREIPSPAYTLIQRITINNQQQSPRGNSVQNRLRYSKYSP